MPYVVQIRLEASPTGSFANAIKLMRRAYEKLPLRDPNRGTEHIITLIAHRGHVQQLELLGRGHDKHLTSKILEVDFIVGSRRGALDFDSAVQISNPIRFARRWFHARNGLAVA